MPKSRAHYLIGQLMTNSLSERELEELLTSMGKDEMNPEYSGILEDYFNALMNGAPTKGVDPPSKEN